MASSIIRFLICLAISACIFSCNEGEVYYKFTPIPENEWSKYQDICFSLDSISIKSVNDNALSLEILHSISYKYKSLFLYLDHIHQDSVFLQDTIECVLVDNYGRWYGSGNGATRQLSVLYKTNFKVDTALHNEICIRHAMQDLKLKGIEKIGLKIY